MSQRGNCVVTEQLDELLQGIDFAFEKTDEPNTPQNEQIRYATALAVIGRFFSKVHPAHADRFFVLSSALADLSSGSRPPILQAPKRRSAPNPTQIEMAKADVAFALDAFMALGEQPHAVARKLLEQFPGIKNLAAPKSQRLGTWEKTILEWRKFFSAPKRRKNKLAAEVFAAGRDLIKVLIGEGRQKELADRAYGRTKHAARVGVFVAPSNPN
jgi:hypothetical protein